MSQYIKEFGVVDNDLQTNIIRIVNKYNKDLEQSLLYSASEDKKFIDLDKRSSKFKAIINEELFDATELLINKINTIDKYYDYKLVRNDVTYIKYESGDFFDKHEDYLSFTSNSIEEYTLIMCVKAECDGEKLFFM